MYRSKEEAHDIFSALSALYHPALLEHAGKLPDWEPIGSPNLQLTHSLAVIPASFDSEVPGDWIQLKEEEGTILLRNISDRDAIVAEAFRRLNIGDHGFDEDFVDSFMALGLAWFVSDLLTRKLRYMSDIDLTELDKFTQASIKAYREQKREEAVNELQKGYDLVCQANEYYFPTPVKFLDLTRINEEEDFGDSLDQMLARRQKRDEKTNLFLPFETLNELEAKWPQTVIQLRKELQEGRVDLLSGDPGEGPLYLFSQTEIIHRLRHTQERFREVLEKEPFVFARKKAGFTPVLPQLLNLTGWKAALLFTYDGWKTDYSNQSRVQWIGPDEVVLPTLAHPPLDGERDEVFMEQLDKMGYSYSADEVMTAIFEHRPNCEVPWLGDVARFNRFSPIFGEVLGIGQYFEKTESVGTKCNFKKDDFRTNFLTRNIEPNPISFWQNHYRDQVDAFSERVRMLLKRIGKVELEQTREKSASSRIETASCTEVAENTESVPVVNSSEPQKARKGFLSRLLGGIHKNTSDELTPTVMVGLKEERLSSREMFRYYFLRNEYFEIRIDVDTGELRRLASYETGNIEMSRGLLRMPGRGNRFACQVALKLSGDDLKNDTRPEQHGGYGYTIMTADRFEIEMAGPPEGRLTVHGRLVMPDGRMAATFHETFTVRRGSRIIDFKITFEPTVEPQDHVWDNYYGCRFVWKDQLAEVRTGVHERLWVTERDYIQAPEAVDIRSEVNIGITLLTNGLPFFRRYGINHLDAILIPKEESERTFKMGIGVDLEQPIITALEYTRPSSLQENLKSLIRWESADTVILTDLELSPDEQECIFYFQETRGRTGTEIVVIPQFSWHKAEIIRVFGAKEETETLVSDNNQLKFVIDRYKVVPVRFYR